VPASRASDQVSSDILAKIGVKIYIDGISYRSKNLFHLMKNYQSETQVVKNPDCKRAIFCFLPSAKSVH
jgi:hypothetical protein